MVFTNVTKQKCAKPRASRVLLSDSDSQDEVDDDVGDDDPPVPDLELKRLSDKKKQFMAKFKPASSALDKARKLPLYKRKPPMGQKGTFSVKGARKSDVSQATLRTRLIEFQGEHFTIRNARLFCECCSREVGSAKSSSLHHVSTKVHQVNKVKFAEATKGRARLEDALQQHYEAVAADGGKCIAGATMVPIQTQLFRAEALQEFLDAGVEVDKLDDLRGFLERHSGHTLSQSSKLVAQFLPALRIKEQAELRDEHKSMDGKPRLISCYFDESPYGGEVFNVITRQVNENLDVVILLIKCFFVKGTLANQEISSLVMQAVSTEMGISLLDVGAHHCDGVEANKTAFKSALSVACPYADLNLCLPHVGSNTGDAMDTPNLEKFLPLWNQLHSKSPRARSIWFEITGDNPMRKKKGKRWYITNDIIEKSLFPNWGNGNTLKWLRQCRTENVGLSFVSQLSAMVEKRATFTLLYIEIVTVSLCANDLKKRSRYLEGDTYEFLYTYQTLIDIRDSLKSVLSPDLKFECTKIAAQAPCRATNDVSTRESRDDRLDAIRALKTLAGVRCSILATYWKWQGAPPPKERFVGEFTRWAHKEDNQVYIMWEDRPGGSLENLLDFEDGANFLLDSKFAFSLEPYVDGRLAPTIPWLPTPWLLARTDLTDPLVIEARCDAIMAPAHAYFVDRVFNQRARFVARAKAARYFDPLFVKAEGATDLDITRLAQIKILKHPTIAPHYAAMGKELRRYLTLVSLIKPINEREEVKKDGTKVDTFNFKRWWQAVKQDLPHTFEVLRAVLLHAPNSCPPERVFSVLSNSFGAQQTNARGDYIELSLQRQFNNRARKQLVLGRQGD